MSYYESQAKQNLDEAKEIAQSNGTWDDISYEHSEAVSTLESLQMTAANDDDFSDVYQDSIAIRNRA